MKLCGAAVIEVREAAGPAREHVLRAGSYTVGSSAQCDVCVGASGVSRRHLQLDVLTDGGVLVADLGSSNGTRFGRRKIERMAVVEVTRLRLGEAELIIHPDTDAPTVVSLPDALADQRPARRSMAPSKATDMPNAGWALVQCLDPALDQIESGIPRESVMSEVLSRWSSVLGGAAMRLHRGGTTPSIVAAAGVVAATAVESCVVRWGEWQLEIDVQPAAALSTAAQQAMRTALAAMTSDWVPDGPVAPVDRSEAEPAGERSILTASPALREVYALATRVARGEVAVLIRGESGVGKDLLARWIHQQSARREGPFLAINCAALPADLLEAEVFGIERGIATGVDARAGLLERARGGTVFLDELGDMAASTQAKILRALESESLYRLGGTRAIPLDVRFVAATHRSLDQLIAEGSFRLDLYHRLAAVELLIPALRERREDIALLATHFLAQELARWQRPSPGITEAALASLCAHDWPGNVRELRNEMARAALLLDAHQALGLQQLSERLRTEAGAETNLSLDQALLRAEQRAFAVALAAAQNDHNKAMTLLRLTRSSYFRRLRAIREQNSGDFPDEDESDQE